MNIIKYSLLSLGMLYTATLYAEVQVVEATPLEPQQIRAQMPAFSPAATNPQAQANLSLDQRVLKLEQQLQNHQQLNLLGQINDLQQAIEQLRGQVDSLNYEHRQLEQRLTQFYQDLNKRLEETKAKPKALVTPINTQAISKPIATQAVAKPKSSAKVNPPIPMNSIKVESDTQDEFSSTNADNFPIATPDQAIVAPSTSQALTQPTKAAAMTPATDSIQEQNAYQTAYNALKNRNYAQAIPAMESYLQTYPNGKYTASAYYWLGELYLVQGQTDKSASQFNALIQQYPNDNKLADATLKLGIIYYNKGQYQEAKATFDEVKTKFPGSAAARLAQRRLQEMANN